MDVLVMSPKGGKDCPDRQNGGSFTEPGLVEGENTTSFSFVFCTLAELNML